MHKRANGLMRIFLLFYLLLSFQLHAALIGQTVVTKILVNGTVVPVKNWSNLVITPQDTIQVYFAVEEKDNPLAKFTYKITLDNEEIKLSSLEKTNSYVTLENLSTGKHRLKIQGYDDEGSTMRAAFQSFNVAIIYSDGVPPSGGGGVDSLYVILLIALAVVQLIIIVVLLMKRKAPEPPPVDAKVDELKDALYMNERLKASVEELRKRNKYLLEQIQNLDTTVKELESANYELRSQKERLLVGKQQLEELQKQREDFFAIAVHDIKNPAGAIKGLVNLLESYDLNANEQQEVMQSLMTSSEHIVKLAQEISTIVADTQQATGLTMEKSSIKKIINSVCSANLAYANRKRVRLINKASMDTPEVTMDKDKISEVIDNLVNNAIKFAPEETWVEVRTWFNDQKIAIEIADNGVGMSEADLKRAFKKGAKLSARPTGDEKSSGLGLWIVKKIVEDHGGKVWVKSKKDVGSTFAFELPLEQDDEDES